MKFIRYQTLNTTALVTGRLSTFKTKLSSPWPIIGKVMFLRTAHARLSSHVAVVVVLLNCKTRHALSAEQYEEEVHLYDF